ncbi:hypothetical protein EM20IM_02865 [Candidatus Methylacidiphilum infernorum]|uniref:Uncharacterized protein n=1 Tax=Candidatus Methylacidiphilum infernorum TaxID=511746 RepID=A0ABX7PWA5_9BACT|nr:hypothetical protein [Candidatus Methylacidiphilum infernorum]QSR87290.1 hypothetical protein EM20IM_02865 [Candidatus Methylacidiphilum infernorum]
MRSKKIVHKALSKEKRDKLPKKDKSSGLSVARKQLIREEKEDHLEGMIRNCLQQISPPVFLKENVLVAIKQIEDKGCG